ncbi:3-dehydroquinate synthase [Arcticibacter tournemirensis]|uniref:3-dehydroquinate synthase n=1 Tax=Arcticibacter tournemirensis TaxID=699437 RepID=A0A5M9GR75_9SPHI|nr:3-dehydroquinate synthase [Arcticibacter tournemirensis]KAA8476265.1 3-dehydroquinate synthase [Arcticibacter tournemirensis]TQM49525.1 3-dehydroquinate synthase [Arcticibacter tournemirensis]
MLPIQSNGYSVFFDNSLASLKEFLNTSDYSKVFFLTDLNTSEHCLPLIGKYLPELDNYDIIEVDPGEENKNIDYCIGVWQMLLDFGADRNSLLINLGGGVITDMGGFAASTFKRGIDFIQIPTTLLSQVDASVGGKTGIDLGSIKNIIGTFTQPKAVFISTEFLKTLSKRQLVSGFAEIVKHGLIADKDYYYQIQNIDIVDPPAEAIYRSVEIKNHVVTTDPFEKGLRKTLNFGHTIGHAVETYSLKNDSDPLLHGEAIALGMICESFLSHKHNGLGEEDLKEIIRYIRSVFPDYSFKPSSYSDVMEFMKNDKKNISGNIGFALLKEIGQCDYNIYLEETQIIESFNYYNSLLNQ